jgi:hypothetical protein
MHNCHEVYSIVSLKDIIDKPKEVRIIFALDILHKLTSNELFMHENLYTNERAAAISEAVISYLKLDKYTGLGKFTASNGRSEVYIKVLIHALLILKDKNIQDCRTEFNKLEINNLHLPTSTINKHKIYFKIIHKHITGEGNLNLLEARISLNENYYKLYGYIRNSMLFSGLREGYKYFKMDNLPQKQNYIEAQNMSTQEIRKSHNATIQASHETFLDYSKASITDFEKALLIILTKE